jgi:transglutaminase-like putative cysteine protease
MAKRSGLTVVLLTVAWSFTTGAAEAQKGFSQSILDRQTVLAAARQVTNQAYPNADLVQVDEFTLCSYRPDGVGDTWTDNYTKVLTEKGRREWQELSFSYLLPYSQTTVTLLEIIRPDGSAVSVDIEKNSKVMINSQQMSSNTYNPNHKVLRIGVPDLQTGDVIHVALHQEIMKRYMPNTWDDYQLFESTQPLKHGIYEVRAPKERPLCRIALKDVVEGTVTHRKEEQDEQIIYRWEISDVPRYYPEPSMPPRQTVVQRLLVSTVSDWKTISRWYWQLCQPHLEATAPPMQDTVDRLTQGLTDRQQKIEAIFQWVSQQVRYLGITVEEESPGWEPHDVKMTFGNRHGVCRDKAALLVAMLRLAGIEAYPVLISAGPRKDAEVPVISFNHAICAVRENDGSWQLMDCTNENTKDLLPSFLCNCSYLVAHPDGDDLQTSPVIAAEKNLVFLETTGDLDAQGNLTARTELRLDGINDSVYRGHLARLKPEERRRLFEGMLRDSIPTGVLTEFDLRPADVQDTSQRISIRMGFTAKDVLVGNGDTVMMPLPSLGTRIGLVNFIIGQTGLLERRFPLYTQVACGVRENLNLRIAPAVGSFVSLPHSPPIKDQTISWKQELEQQGNSLHGESEFLIHVVEFNPQQYQQLKQTLKQIEYNGRKMPILARPTRKDTPAPDIVVLDHQVDYNLADAHNWTERHHVRKKILTYKGKKDNAELKLDYNPAWEQVNLISATVTNAEQVKQVSKEETNLMDADWVASAPRYPPAKTLVVSLPAVEVGSVIEYEYERVKKDRPFFAVTHVFRGFDPVERETVKLTAPASLALQILKDDNGVAVPDEEQTSHVIIENEEHQDGKITRQWKVQDQVPVKKEDSLPPLYSFSPVLRITAGNWHTYAQEVHAVLREAARGQTAAEQQAREITLQAKSPQEKMVALRDFVARNIRSAGPGCDALPLRAIMAADRTLADGYGNTTDQAVLLYAMLQATGLSPEFVLVNYGSAQEQLKRFEAQYPASYTFSQVLIRLYDGATPIYLNDTDQYAVLGATPADGRLALPVAKGETETLCVAPDKKESWQYECRLALTEDGNARIALTRRIQGDAFAARHKKYEELRPEERNRYYQEMVAEVAQAAVADSNLVTDFDSYPGVESFRVRVEKYAVRDGDFLYFEQPNSLRRLFGLRSDTHENPFYTDYDGSMHFSTVVELPPGFSNVVLAPKPEKWRLPAGGGTVQIDVTRQEPQASGSTILTVTCDVDLNPCILSPEDYTDLLAIEKKLAHPSARTVLVTRRK